MKVTNAKVFLTQSTKSKVAGYATITLDKAFVVGGLSVVEGSKGAFVKMPQFKGKDNSYNDESYPLSKELRKEINDSVLSAYEKAKEQSQEAQPEEAPQENEDEIQF